MCGVLLTRSTTDINTNAITNSAMKAINHALHAWQSSRVIDRWDETRASANEQRDCKYAGNCANELRDDIKQRVPILHFAKTPKSQSDRWIKMRAGPLAERRENQRDRRAAHRDSRQHASDEFAGE